MWKRFSDAVGWSSRQAILFLVFLCLFIAVPFALEGDGLNTAVLWLTGIVVLLYTVETHGLRVEMVRQNEMAVQPMVILTIDDREMQRTAIGSKNFLVLRNIGRGPALFVKIKDIEFAELEGSRYVMRFDTVDFIEPKTERIAEPNILAGTDQTASPGHVSHLDPRYAIQTLLVKVTYEDINGQKHESLVRMGKGGIRLLSCGKL